MLVTGMAMVLVAQIAVSDLNVAVEKREEQFAVAWNGHDGAAMAATWTPDGDFMNPFGEFAHGRAAIEKLFDGEHEGSGTMAKSTYRFHLDSVRLVTPDVAVADWTNSIDWAEGPDGQRPPAFKHHVTTVFVRTDGEWWKASERASKLMPRLENAPPR